MKQRFIYLFQRHFDKTSSAQEREELLGYLRQSQYDDTLKQLLVDTWEQEIPAYKQEQVKADAIFNTIINTAEKAKVKHMFTFRRIAIAASLLITIGIAAYVILSGVEGQHKKELSVVEVPTDVPAPDKNRAQIKLADGTILYLDSAANGQLVNTNGVTVTKTEDGKIVYTPSAVATPTAVGYNTLSNPRGSKVQPLTLSDGSKVWLNAESSITYPTAFVGNQRKVTINGEAYFEVAKSFTASGAKQTFIVEANGTATEVLGTHFNVNAYDDEQEIKVTLLEGKVKVTNINSRLTTHDSRLLSPGEQAVLTPDSRLTTNGSPDIDQVLAWKNGRFSFNKADIKTVMRQLARWYDLEVEYKGTPTNDLFGGDMQRDLPLSKVLDFLKKSQVKFEVEGKKVIVQ